MCIRDRDWDYTLAGLSHITREKIDAIREAVKELEKAGSIVRSRERDEKGRLRGAEMCIRDSPSIMQIHLAKGLFYRENHYLLRPDRL